MESSAGAMRLLLICAFIAASTSGEQYDVPPLWGRQLIDTMAQMQQNMAQMQQNMAQMQQSVAQMQQNLARVELKTDDIRDFGPRRVSLLRNCTRAIHSNTRFAVITKAHTGQQRFLVTAQHNLPLIADSEVAHLKWCCHPEFDLAVAVGNAAFLNSGSACDMDKTTFKLGEDIVSFSPVHSLATVAFGRGSLVGELMHPVQFPGQVGNDTVPLVAAPGFLIVNINLFGGYSGSAVSNSKILGTVVGEMPCLSGDNRLCGVVAPSTEVLRFFREVSHQHFQTCGTGLNMEDHTKVHSCSLWRNDEFGRQLRSRLYPESH